jgi:hypothetical protein
MSAQTALQRHQNVDYDQIAMEILAEADSVDRAEDERFGDRRGDELPPELSTAQGRRGGLREAQRRHDEQRAAKRSRSRSRALSGCAKASAGSKRTTMCIAARTRLTRPIARVGG